MPAGARAAGSFEERLADLERTITATIETRLDRRISDAVEDTLSDGERSRRVTERVYAALYDRIVLERERLG